MHNKVNFKRADVYPFRKKRKIGTKRLLLLLAFFCIIAVMPVAYGPFFAIKNIRVTGTKTIDPNEVIKAASIFYDKNLLMIKPGAVKAAVLAAVPVKEVTVKYRFPHTIIINVKEREVAAAIPYFGSFALIDSNGIIVKIVPKLDFLNIPVVTGLDISAARIASKPVVDKKVDSFEKLLTLISDINSFSGELSEIHVDTDEFGETIFDLYTLDGYQIFLGSYEKDKLPLAKEILDSLRKNHMEKGKLDLSGNTPVFKPFSKR